jgi:predicted ribosome quality control (RQC) complex YloA/Tae2 family protein
MKFREIALESGTKFLLGKDEKSNDELMKKFEGKNNIILHTIAPGSPFCVIEKIVFKGDVYAAGVLCARYSQKWRDNKEDVIVSVFTGKDIKKEKGMKTGTWKVKKSRTIIIKKEDILKIIKG